MTDYPTIMVKNEAPGEPLAARTFAILKDRIEQRCASTVVASSAENEAGQIILALAEDLPAEGFSIQTDTLATRITGGSGRGLLYGVGKFLRASRYHPGFQPSTWQGSSAPRGGLRGMYFATHFHNWYHVAPPEEFTRYLEDLALWGVNTIMVIFPMINLQDWDDPQAAPAMQMVRQYASAARELGMGFATALNNTMFKGAPPHLRATPLPDPTGRRGNSGHPICPSSPQGLAYLLDNARQLCVQLADVGVDYLCYWPYDEGGCACENCQPWGSRGYLRLSQQFTDLARGYFPGVKTILSTWMFDTPPEGEWQGLRAALEQDPGWVDYILADAHEDFPRYPLEVGSPAGKPLINFPEISMWGNWPWGGVGANPLPSRFQRLWDQVKGAVSGGFPYSEGIYEDMNKAIVTQFYWDGAQRAETTLREYIAYEFDAAVVEETLALIDLLEETAGRSYLKQAVEVEPVQRAARLAEQIQARLPAWARQNWRWEILHLRAILDHERFAGGGLETPAAESAMRRLVEIYHCQMETDDPYHHRVRPPLRQAVSRNGEY